MDVMRQGEGSGVEKEVMENMRHQLQLLSQVNFSSNGSILSRPSNALS